MPKLTNLTVEYVSLVDRAAVRDPSNPTEPQRFLLWKSERGAPDPQGGSMTEEELRAALQKAESERDAAQADLAKANKKLAKKAAKSKDDDADADAVSKADLPEPVRAALQKAEDDRAEALRKAEEAEKLAKAERDLRVEREFIAKAEAEFPELGSAADLGPRLKRMSESLSKEDYDAHLQQLAAANEQIAKGALFGELGRGGDPAHGSDSGELARKAEEIRKSDPSLSSYGAMERALRENPELQRTYLNQAR